MSFNDKVILVTGGSRGIGFATARLFSENGANVVISAIDPRRLEESSKKIRNCSSMVCDNRDSNQVQNMIKKITDEFGKIDVLVNNAGIFPTPKRLHEISEEEWNKVIDVNLTGQFRVSKEVIPHMLERGGVIINVASDAGLKAYEGFSVDHYSASKAALILMTKTMALEYAKEGIRVNCVCPGVVDTDMAAPYLQTQKDREMVDAAHPLGRIGRPEDVARSILFLASSESSWTTGAALTVDGGESIK